MAALSVPDGNADAGTYQDSEDIGEAAVQLLISLMHHNERGVPEICHELLVEGRWVDGSTRFRALMGWFRLVCSNGLVIGVTRARIRHRHVGDFCLGDVDAVLTSGLTESETEKSNFEKWRKTPITWERLIPWVEKRVRKVWGFKAAARTFHIARSGSDVEIVGQYKDSTPTTIPVRETKRVSGAPKTCSNLFDVSQILAWLAKERHDIQEQLEWRDQIPDLLKSLN